MSLTLHHFPPSPNAVKVAAVLHHLGASFQEKIVDITKGGGQDPAFRKINPNGMIPALTDDDFAIWESNAIILYLAEKHSSPLIPSDPRKRAEMHQWMCWQLAHWSPAVGPLQFERLAPHFIPGYKTDEDTVNKALEKLERFGPVLDAHLSGRQYILGPDLSLADFALASQLVHWRVARIPLEKYPNLLSWYGRIEKLESFQKAAPKMQAPA